ncbi:MAG TPA: hypothetical protein VN030_11285 [Cellvibrio sp.]|nr:hypothetical protein [Cellvibrio sp.]
MATVRLWRLAAPGCYRGFQPLAIGRRSGEGAFLNRQAARGHCFQGD